MTKEKQNAANVCSQCGSTKIRAVRRTRVYGDIVIENLPATWCPNCGEELYDVEEVDFIEKVLADPDKYSTWVPRRVARVA
ncbi:MAG: type II toxin-antitoxin system MqsA family antitoxin [Blastocatellia bacterium]